MVFPMSEQDTARCDHPDKAEETANGRAQAEISSASAMFLDEKSTEYVLQLVEQQGAPGWTGWMPLIAFGVLLFTASKVVVELREVLR